MKGTITGSVNWRREDAIFENDESIIPPKVKEMTIAYGSGNPEMLKNIYLNKYRKPRKWYEIIEK